MNELFELARQEATRVVPGVMAARLRNDCLGAATLLRDYHQTCHAFGLSKAEAWTQLWAATLQWALDLAVARAMDSGDDPLAYVQQIGISAAAWHAGLELFNE